MSSSSKPSLPLATLKDWAERKKRIAQREREQASAMQRVPPLLEFVPITTPRWSSPVWLLPFAEVLEQAVGGQLRQVVAAPPQHGKTELCIHALSWMLRKFPGRRHAYATYAQTRSDSVARKARAIAQRAGVQVTGPLRKWTTPGEGSLIFTSVGGPLTGEPVDGLLLIDDPYKDRKHAESPAYAEQVMDWLDDVAETRVHPGASIIVMATRWTPKDLSGLLTKRGWPYLNIKAISDERDQHPKDTRGPGEALCTARKPIAELERLRRVNPFSFASLYQGEPRPRGGALFGEAHRFKLLPTVAVQTGYGTDLSYSAKSSSDWSVCIRMLREPIYVVAADGRASPLLSPEGRKLYRYYITHVERRQCKAPEWARVLKTQHDTQGARGTVFWRAAGTEQGVADLMRQNGVRLVLLKLKGDKFTHAQKFAEAWNDGRVLVPESAPWLEAFVDELQNFVGKDGEQDDQVDAAVAAFDGLEAGTLELDTSMDSHLPGLRM